MDRIKRFWADLSIRFKLLLSFTAVIFFLSSFNLYLNNTNYQMLDQFNETMTDYYRINELMTLLQDNRQYLDIYIRELDQEALNQYQLTEEALKIHTSRLYDRFSSQEAYFSLNAISNSIDSYTGLWGQSVEEREKGIDTYYEAYYSGTDIYLYTETYVQTLLYTSLEEGSELYNALEAQADLMRRISTVLIAGAFMVAFAYALFFASYLVRPIKRLADASTRMAEGNLDIEAVRIESGDEVGILADSFNTMSESISGYVKDLEQKVIIEKKLHDEEMAIIRMEHLLQSAEFQALQSQVNPHFLFNTLNTISRTAMFEDAEDTVKLIQALSNLLRYRIRSSEDEVTLAEELDLIQEYIYLQKMRFKDRLNFVLDVKGNVDTLHIPVFTLQPLVENAIIHGIEPKIQGGTVRIKVRSKKDRTVIAVTDSGIGISKERLRALLDRSRLKNAERIGVANVYNRFKLHYGSAGSFRMLSREGIGTYIRLVINKE